jgi:methylmalonyl-CoA/ethylmalonyl-CoA epimerase
MIKQVDHIGIAVHSLEDHIPFYRDILGLKFLGIETVEDQKVRTAIFQVGQTRIELLEPTADDSPISGFLQKRGEGMHHIAFRSDHLEDELQKLKANGIRLIDEHPRPGAHNNRIAFIHPKFSGKVLTELCEPDQEQ